MQVSQFAFIATWFATFIATNQANEQSIQQRVNAMHARQMGRDVSNEDLAPPDYNSQLKDSFKIKKGRKAKSGHAHSGGRCGKNQGPNAKDLPASYNDKSTGFFVDMGLILTDYYGVTAKMSKLQMNSIARTFTAPVHSFAKAQKGVSTTDLHNSVLGLLQILVDHNVNDTSIRHRDLKNYKINRRVFSEIQINDLLRTRARLLKTAKDRDNGSEEVIYKETAVRKMQLKIFEAKDPSTMNAIIATGVSWRQYRTRFAQYMWNICAHTQDRETIRQVRNHFAYWLATGQEDLESEQELTATYSDTGNPSSFFYPQGVKLSLASALYTLLGAALIGVFLSV